MGDKASSTLPEPSGSPAGSPVGPPVDSPVDPVVEPPAVDSVSSPTAAPAPIEPGLDAEPAETHAPLLVDENPQPEGEDDLDSAYGSDSSSTGSTSISSSIFHYQYENGRRYHAYRHGGYVLPNDDLEQERLDLQHHIWRLLLQGSLYLAPLTEYREKHGTGTRILDLGCGTGIWAIDIADEFPDSTVLGVDLSPIQPEWVPPNCRFYVDDFEDEWTYREDEKFDYIHGRAVLGSTSDWPALYRKCLRFLKPGGLLEIQEYDAWVFSDDDSCQRARWTMEWVTKLEESSNLFGKPINIAKFHKQWIIDAGFEDVEETVKRIPIGPWTKDERLKELGRYERIHMQMSVASHTPALFTRVLGYTAQQASVLIEGVRREFRNNDLRLITAYRFITARAPEAAT